MVRAGRVLCHIQILGWPGLEGARLKPRGSNGAMHLYERIVTKESMYTAVTIYFTRSQRHEALHVGAH